MIVIIDFIVIIRWFALYWARQVLSKTTLRSWLEWNRTSSISIVRMFEWFCWIYYQMLCCARRRCIGQRVRATLYPSDSVGMSIYVCGELFRRRNVHKSKTWLSNSICAGQPERRVSLRHGLERRGTQDASRWAAECFFKGNSCSLDSYLFYVVYTHCRSICNVQFVLSF